MSEHSSWVQGYVDGYLEDHPKATKEYARKKAEKAYSKNKGDN